MVAEGNATALFGLLGFFKLIKFKINSAVTLLNFNYQFMQPIAIFFGANLAEAIR